MLYKVSYDKLRKKTKIYELDTTLIFTIVIMPLKIYRPLRIINFYSKLYSIFRKLFYSFFFFFYS